MNITCDQCKKANQGRYKTFPYEYEDKKGKVHTKLTTMCYVCLDAPALSQRTDKQLFEHISTPYWQHMGLEPKPKEKAQLQYMKAHGMSWGDMRKARYANMPTTNQGAQTFEKHYNKYGRSNAPDAAFKKESN